MATTETLPLNHQLRSIMEESRRREGVIRERMEWVEARRRQLWQRREELDALLADMPQPLVAAYDLPSPQMPEPATP